MLDMYYAYKQKNFLTYVRLVEASEGSTFGTAFDNLPSHPHHSFGVSQGSERGEGITGDK